MTPAPWTADLTMMQESERFPSQPLKDENPQMFVLHHARSFPPPVSLRSHYTHMCPPTDLLQYSFSNRIMQIYIFIHSESHFKASYEHYLSESNITHAEKSLLYSPHTQHTPSQDPKTTTLLDGMS